MFSLTSWERGNAASLFDRIQEEGSLTSTHTFSLLSNDGKSEVVALVDSVKRHLECLLNTRPGSCCSAPELGVIDLNDVGMNRSDIKVRISEAIQFCIHCYEPRVVYSEVYCNEVQDDCLGLSFQIIAHVCLENIERVTSFNVHMDSQRHYNMV